MVTIAACREATPWLGRRRFRILGCLRWCWRRDRSSSAAKIPSEIRDGPNCCRFDAPFCAGTVRDESNRGGAGRGCGGRRDGRWLDDDVDHVERDSTDDVAESIASPRNVLLPDGSCSFDVDWFDRVGANRGNDRPIYSANDSGHHVSRDGRGESEISLGPEADIISIPLVNETQAEWNLGHHVAFFTVIG